MKILITGATGFIGKKLGEGLVQKGHQLVVVSRNESKARAELTFPCEVIVADLNDQALKPFEIEGVEAVIHLLGESVAGGRWTEKRKQEILDSRIKSTQNLVKSFRSCKTLRHFISTSAIGFYGDRADEVLVEESVPGKDFLSQVCVQWEAEAFKLKTENMKVSIVRVGLVLGKNGGALTKMLTPFRLGLGGKLSDGKQWMSWIHLEDLVRIYSSILEKELEGIFNAVAPSPVQNSEWTSLLCRSLNRPQNLPVPKFVLKTLFGEMSEVLLASQKVRNQKILDLGFRFKFNQLQDAFEDILKT